MHNIETYIEFRGDIKTNTCPYNEVDMLTFASMAYIDFSSIKEMLPLTLEQVALEMNKNSTVKNRKELNLEYKTFEQISKQERYKNIKLYQYENIHDEIKNIQFAAITLQLSNNVIGVFFSGTDDSVVGWHENFNMYTNDMIGSHKKAISYLHDAAAIKLNSNLLFWKKSKLILGGHSKGGNLAIVAALHSIDLHERIVKVFNFDGPGVSDDSIKIKGYSKMIKKVITYTPSYSFFGQLFRHDEKQLVIKSCNSGLAQHDINSWEVNTRELIRTQLDKNVFNLHIHIDEFIKEVGKEHLTEFIEVLFLFFKKMNLTKMSNIKNIDILKIGECLHELPNEYMKYKILIIKLISMINQENKKARVNI